MSRSRGPRADTGSLVAGVRDKRAYPWGDVFQAARCNSSELGLRGTSPVGIFAEGAGPYGLLDMAGNVWEWTRSIYQPYPYCGDDGRNAVDADEPRVVRGGSWIDLQRLARCASRFRLVPDYFYYSIGLRVFVSLSNSGF